MYRKKIIYQKRDHGGALMEEKYWKQFISSGSIEDYLQYCRVKNQAEQEAVAQGEDDGREHYGDRDDLVGPTDG